MKYLRLSLMGACLLLAACNKLTVENYDKMKAGMPYAEVKTIFGAPAKCSEALGLKHCTWGDETRHIDVSFINDQAVLFTGENIH